MGYNISLVVATDKNNGIGINNTLLCHLPKDLKYFKNLTSGHTVIMGRKTYDSIGKPLPNRKNIILSRNKDFEIKGCVVIHSIPELIQIIPASEEVFIIGGQSIFSQTIKYASKIYLTCIESTFEADSYFPKLDTEKDWKSTKIINNYKDEKHLYDFSFITYERRSNSKHTNVSQHLIDF